MAARIKTFNKKFSPFRPIIVNGPVIGHTIAKIQNVLMGTKEIAAEEILIVKVIQKGSKLLNNHHI